MSRSARLALSLTALLALAAPAWAQGKKDTVRNYGIGHAATPEQIAGWDIDVRPDGAGRAAGTRLGEGGREGLHGQMRRLPRRVRRKRRALAAARARQGHARLQRSGQDRRLVFSVSLERVRLHPPRHAVRRRAVAHATTSFMRSPPMCSTSTILSTTNSCCRRQTWGQVKMPNQSGFFDDDRDKAEKAFWNAKPCMSDCRPPVKITGRARRDRRDAGREDPEARRGGVASGRRFAYDIHPNVTSRPTPWPNSISPSPCATMTAPGR